MFRNVRVQALYVPSDKESILWKIVSFVDVVDFPQKVIVVLDVGW